MYLLEGEAHVIWKFINLEHTTGAGVYIAGNVSDRSKGRQGCQG